MYRCIFLLIFIIYTNNVMATQKTGARERRNCDGLHLEHWKRGILANPAVLVFLLGMSLILFLVLLGNLFVVVDRSTLTWCKNIE